VFGGTRAALKRSRLFQYRAVCTRRYYFRTFRGGHYSRVPILQP